MAKSRIEDGRPESMPQKRASLDHASPTGVSLALVSALLGSVGYLWSMESELIMASGQLDFPYVWGIGLASAVLLLWAGKIRSNLAAGVFFGLGVGAFLGFLAWLLPGDVAITPPHNIWFGLFAGAVAMLAGLASVESGSIVPGVDQGSKGGQWRSALVGCGILALILAAIALVLLYLVGTAMEMQ
jgi:hypothetical protein